MLKRVTQYSCTFEPILIGKICMLNSDLKLQPVALSKLIAELSFQTETCLQIETYSTGKRCANYERIVLLTLSLLNIMKLVCQGVNVAF